MKKTLFSIMLMSFLLCGALSAQTGARFGMKAGFNLATQYGIKPADDLYTVSSTGRNGFAGGVIIYYPITESVGIQQELLYVMKGSGQDVTITTPLNINTKSE